MNSCITVITEESKKGPASNFPKVSMSSVDSSVLGEEYDTFDADAVQLGEVNLMTLL